MGKPKQEFQLGDIAYIVDCDCKYCEEVQNVSLCEDNTIEYSTYNWDFTANDIGKWVFKTEEDRDNNCLKNS